MASVSVSTPTSASASVPVPIVGTSSKSNSSSSTSSSSSSPTSVAAVAAAGGGLDIQKIMKSSGPVVTAVVLQADGTVHEILFDTTPKRQHAADVLGGPFTFLGQYESEGIMLMIRKSENENEQQLPLNQHKLQVPFESTQVYGDILCIRVAAEDEDEEDDNKDEAVVTVMANNSSETKSNEEFFLPYTVEEYKVFAARTDVVAPVAPVEDDEDINDDEDEEEEEEEEEEMEGESDSDDDDDEADDEGEGGLDIMAMLMSQVLQRFQVENDRMPNEEELAALESAIAQKLGGGVGSSLPS
mmetsp:Transcript_45015/g.51046  ORF Transcript_45015/g.51046 Transcript_45015/m.51046 type:complete len:300 (+) Transcript_45015:65-964(+)